MNDDLDTPGAIAYVWETINKGSLSENELKTFLMLASDLLGLGFDKNDDFLDKLSSSGQVVSESAAPEAVQELFKKREDARAAKNWADADRLRAEISEKGYNIEDTASGARLIKK
jgi:cysteinyl-tRNA synthetase